MFDFTDIKEDGSDVSTLTRTNIEPAQFDFADIKDGDFEEEVEEVEDEFGEFEDDEEEEVEVEEDLEDTSSITEALSQLGAIDDDFELDFGTTKVAKGELVKLIADRESIIKTRDAIEGLGNRMAGREKDIELFYTVSKTETDKQLEHVYSMLNDPNKWNSSVDVAQLQKNRIHLEARKAELDKTRETALASLKAQKEELDTARIQRVVAEMGGQAPIQEAATYAESKGIDLTVLVAGASPALITALQNAKRYEELVAKNKSKLAAVSKAKKPRSTPVKAKASGKASPSERARAHALYQAGKMSHSDIFNFLED